MTSAVINYAAPMAVRPRYHANDQSRDVLDLDPRAVALINGRVDLPSLGCEGFALIDHASAVPDFRDPSHADLYRAEIAALVQQVTNADHISIAAPGLLRFGERSHLSGKLNNSRPARFIHVDVNDETAAAFANRGAPEGRTIRRFAHFNIWRVITPPPQDVPLCLCDARSIADGDLIEADAVFDEPNAPEWSFTGLVVAHNPAHRWTWFPDMTHDEAIIFKTNDSDPDAPHCVPHSAFDNAEVGPEVEPRGSIEMRAIAYWFG
jgi:hypothetical protein